jgi:nucleoside-diphosphate-sugar epimerase
MRTVVIGGTGHIGTYLVPGLVALGHEVVSVSRGNRQPYQFHRSWEKVQKVVMDRMAEEQAGSFAQKIRDLRPDVVIDLICFTHESARHLVEALDGRVQQFLHCGTIWVHGPSAVVPTTEDWPRRPFGDYGIRKAQIEAYLLDQARRRSFPATVLHPGHIVGPGWVPINPAGNLDVGVFASLARGEEIALPNLGLETLHHVHAVDVAQAFVNAMTHWSSAVGESFHVVSPAALTLRGYAEAAADWFGKPARLKLLAWNEWRETVDPQDAALTWDHIAHSPNCSIAKAERQLGYHPLHTSLEAVHEAVMWLITQRKLVV